MQPGAVGQADVHPRRGVVEPAPRGGGEPYRQPPHRVVVGEADGDPLQALPAVTDVLVNGPDEVWIDRGEGLERTAVRFPDDDAVRRLAVRLATAAGRRLDDAAPWVDAGLPDGTRLHAVLPPVSGSGT